MKTQAGFYFKKISEKLEKRTNHRKEERDITFSQGKILWYLHEHENEDVTMRDIERFFDCSHATVSGIVSRLEEKGYVSLETSENDRRAKNVRLTEKEKADFRNMQFYRQRIEEVLLKGFTDEEKKTLSAYLERVYANLEEDGEACEREKKEIRRGGPPAEHGRNCPRRPCRRGRKE